MAAFPVPRYLAETARRDRGVHDWIAGLPAIVAGLACRWSLHVGEPFQPGGQCSWTAPAIGPDGASLVLKVAFRFPGGEERDEAAGLRTWHGNGTARLLAACQTDSAYALLAERCLPGTPLGRVLPEPEQDLIVTRLLAQLWAAPHGGFPNAIAAHAGRLAVCEPGVRRGTGRGGPTALASPRPSGSVRTSGSRRAPESIPRGAGRGRTG